MIKSRLKILLATKETTQRQLAIDTECREATINALANNRIKQVPIDMLDKLCKYFDCQPSDILVYEPDKGKVCN